MSSSEVTSVPFSRQLYVHSSNSEVFLWTSDQGATSLIPLHSRILISLIVTLDISLWKLNKNLPEKWGSSLHTLYMTHRNKSQVHRAIHEWKQTNKTQQHKDTRVVIHTLPGLNFFSARSDLSSSENSLSNLFLLLTFTCEQYWQINLHRKTSNYEQQQWSHYITLI